MQDVHQLAELLKLYHACRRKQHPQVSAYTLMCGTLTKPAALTGGTIHRTFPELQHKLMYTRTVLIGIIVLQDPVKVAVLQPVLHPGNSQQMVEVHAHRIKLPPQDD